MSVSAAVLWLGLRLWGVPPAVAEPEGPGLAVEAVHGAIVRVAGRRFPPGEPIVLSIDEYRGGFTDCRGDGVNVRADRRGRLLVRLHIPPCAFDLCAAHTETLAATAQFACGSDCRQGHAAVFACPARWTAIR